MNLAAESMLAALDDPRVAQRWKELLNVRAEVLAALAEREADGFMSPKQAALYVYGCAGKDAAFAKMRRRHPELDALSIGTGKNRRWRRSGLSEAWGRLHPGFLRS